MSKPSIQTPFSSIQISQLDGRAQSFRHKQAQLYRLYEALTRSASKLKLAIQADAFLTATEADFEFAQALAEIRLHYDSLDLQRELKITHQIETGADNVERTRLVATAYIVPAKESLAFSVLSALGAAVAAGSCVIVELPQTLTQTSSVLRRILTDNMDPDTFALAGSRPPSDFTRKCMLVNQTGEEVNPAEWAQVLHSPSQARTVAVIDRTANLAEAAKVVAEANFTFGGTAAYAPQTVLVNEFVAETFLSGLVSNVGTADEAKVNGHAGPEGKLRVAKDSSEAVNTKTLISGSRGKIIEFLDRQTPLWTRKPDERTILVHRISSLDDALSLLKRTLSNRQQPLAASFLFATLPEANYLSRHINSYICTINHIPLELLAGPLAPIHSCIPAAPFPRYKPAMFTVPAPQYLPPKDHLPTSLSSPAGEGFVRKLMDRAMQPLPPIVQGDGKNLNFFGEAIVVGFSMGLASIVGIGLGSWWLVFGGHTRGKWILF